MENNAQKPTSEVIHDFMQMTGCTRACLYGGAAVDRYINPQAEVMDYDLAIGDIDSYRSVVGKLKDFGFDVGEPRSNNDFSVVAKHPQYGKFDLICMDIKKNGIYNLEKFYIEFSEEYPYGRAIDAYNTVDGLRRGVIKPVNDPDKEHAYDLLRRFSVLAGKYDFSLDREGVNKETIDILHRRLGETPVDKSTEYKRMRCLARFLGAAFRTQNMEGYLEGMGKTELFKYGFPAINDVLHSEEFLKGIKENQPADKFELIERMIGAAQDRDAMADEMMLLQKRERDREDPRVIHRVDALGEEKTSPKRLNRSILSPVFSYILSGKREK